MTFKEYFLKESPDQVYSPEKRKLAWYSRHAIAFGTIHGIRDISDFFIQSTAKEVSHYDMLENFCDTLQNCYLRLELKAKRASEDIDLGELQELIETKLAFHKKFKIETKVCNRISLEVVKSKNYLMELLVNGTLLDTIESKTWKNKRAKTEIEADLGNAIRTEIYKNAGRVWPSSKVISFWLTDDQLTPKILDDTFNNLKISDKQNYFIDVVNLEDLEKEETKTKVLPSYKDYKKKSAPVKVSKEQRKRAQEFMAKQHGVAGAQKAKFETDKELPEIGAKKYAMQKPLELRQQVQTSESVN
jgi:hypothetical protein